MRNTKNYFNLIFTVFFKVINKCKQFNEEHTDNCSELQKMSIWQTLPALYGQGMLPLRFVSVFKYLQFWYFKSQQLYFCI